jgi:hypothetical protein
LQKEISQALAAASRAAAATAAACHHHPNSVALCCVITRGMAEVGYPEDFKLEISCIFAVTSFTPSASQQRQIDRPPGEQMQQLCARSLIDAAALCQELD